VAKGEAEVLRELFDVGVPAADVRDVFERLASGATSPVQVLITYPE